MSFYGNITDTSPTHFQFDKIFNNRAEMDRALELGTDNVFAGRFVLIRYDTDNSYVGDIIYGYQKENSTAIYLDKNYQYPYVFTTFTEVEEPNENNWESYFCKSKNRNYYFKIPNKAYFQENSEETFYTSDTQGNTIVCINKIVRIKDENDNLTNLFYQCSGAMNGQSATWTEILPNDSYPAYFTNFWIDSQTYFNNFDYRGYDGTVWQKVYSEGQGKFVLIAHLNGIAPGFELVSDEPSINPADVYIDSKSTDSLYRIHTPSHWGFRIKRADESQGEISDQSIIQPYPIYDPETNELVGISRIEIPANIYFNKAGFDDKVKTYDRDSNNKLVIEPSGASGKKYANSVPGGDDPIDTYELSISFPAFGNVISEFYDVIYGNPEEEEGNIDNKRHLDIKWYEADENMDYRINGDPLLNGKTRNLNSAAGLINTLQDRLGQILKRINVPLTSLSELDELDDNYIYVYTNPETDITTYYRIGDGYEYNLIDDENDITYTDIGTLTEDEYFPNNYYIKNNNDEFVIASNSYINYPNNTHFYQKNISTKKFEEIDLMGYQQNTYYYKNDNNYYLDTAPNAPTYPSAPYYEIPVNTPLNFDYYYSNDLYIKDDDGKFISVNSINGYIPDMETTYYSLSTSLINSETPGMRLYQPGLYYYYGDDGYPKLDSNEYTYETFQLVSGRTYYTIPTSDELTYVYDTDHNQVIVGYVLDEANKQQVNLYCPDTSINNIYASNANGTMYIPLNKISDKSIDYIWYQITSSTILGSDLFIPGLYYKKEENDYIIANEYQAGTNYYLLDDVVRLPSVFYEKNKYYYRNADQYSLDTSNTMTNNRTYYIETPLYVYNDNSGRWSYGCEWAEQSIYVPASVELATREKIKKAYELTDVNNGESSINGIILKLDKLIDKNNDGTRDLSTIKGSINSIKDLTSSISGNLVPGRILFINDFGQIAVTPITLTQLQTLLNRTTTLEGEVNTLKQQMIGVLGSNALNYNSTTNSYGLKTKVDDILGENALDYDSNNNSYGLKTRVDTLENITINGYTDQGNNIDGLVSKVGTLETNISNILSSSALDYNSTTGVYGLKDKVDTLESAVGNNTGSDLTSRIGTLEDITINGYTDQGNNIDGLVTKVGTLENTVGDSSNGLVSEVANLDSRVQDLENANQTPETPPGE